MGQTILAPDMIFSLNASLLILTLIGSFSLGMLVKVFYTQQSYSSNLDYAGFEITINDNVFKKKLSLLIFILGIISILGSIFYLFIFIRHFGSLFDLLTAGWTIREEIGAGNIQVPIIVRIMFLLAYPTISLSLIYWIVYEFKMFLILPFLTIIVFGTTQAARAGSFIVIIWVFITSFWKNLFSGNNNYSLSIIKRIILYPLLIIAIFILGLMYREQNIEIGVDFLRFLHVFNIYVFGGISAFSRFLDTYSSASDMTLGLYSFSSLFDLLGISKLSFGYYDEYLSISNFYSDTTNVYTMFRSLIEDFGIAGSHVYMFLLGLFSGKIYSMTMKGNLSALSVLSALYTLFVYSPIAPFTQHTSLFLCFIIPAALIKFIHYKLVL
jgi:oligosaccharide repeat unit polymerase